MLMGKTIMSLLLIVGLIYSMKDCDVEKLPSVSNNAMKYMKIFAIINIIMAALMISDCIISENVVEGKVIKNGIETRVKYENYEDIIKKGSGRVFSEGEIVEIGLTKIFQEVFYVQSGTADKRINFAMEDFYSYIFLIIFFIMPILFLFDIEINSSMEKMAFFLLATANSIGGIISLVIFVKLTLVHILNVIERV